MGSRFSWKTGINDKTSALWLMVSQVPAEAGITGAATQRSCHQMEEQRQATETPQQ